ncbi:MAG: hypothetical protein ABW217_01610 [Polyangiaceae bacterium]
MSWCLSAHGRLRALSLCAGAVLLAACQSEPTRAAPPPSYPQQAYPPQQYGSVPPPTYSNQAVPPPPTFQGQASAPQPPYQPAPPANVGADPINQQNLAWMRSEASGILSSLVQALPSASQQRVLGIPLVFDDAVGEVNAFAACDSGRSLMAISDGLLEIGGWLAQAQAHDSIFGTRKADEYIAFVARYQKPDQPIVRPPADFFPNAQQFDPRKVALQHQVFDELVAFVLGHELAHHHLGHLPCTGSSGPLGSGDIARVLSSTIPLLNQPNELTADWEGTKNVLAAGTRRPAGQAQWTENGGLLMMRFFSGMDGQSPLDIVFAFERSHPPPALRIPLIQQSAYYWRTTGGVGLPAPRIGG